MYANTSRNYVLSRSRGKAYRPRQRISRRLSDSSKTVHSWLRGRHSFWKGHAQTRDRARHAGVRLISRAAQEEVDVYERIVRADISRNEDLTSIGRMLISLRIASRITQRELASRLRVSKAAVARTSALNITGLPLTARNAF